MVLSVVVVVAGGVDDIGSDDIEPEAGGVAIGSDDIEPEAGAVMVESIGAAGVVMLASGDVVVVVEDEVVASVAGVSAVSVRWQAAADRAATATPATRILRRVSVILDILKQR